MSLLDITKLPTAENSAIYLHSGDNVAIARVPVSQGMMLRVAGREVRTRAAIPNPESLCIVPLTCTISRPPFRFRTMDSAIAASHSAWMCFG